MIVNDKLYETTPKHHIKKSDLKVIGERATRFLFYANPSRDLINHITEYIEIRFKELGCCALYELNDSFMEWCAKFPRDLPSIGEKEVIITSGGNLLVTNNYHLPPK